MTVETTELRPGHRISRILKGGWQLAGDHGAVRPAQAIADMEAFLDAGITTFDCADIYKGVEEMIGTFIADVRRRRGAEVADRVVVHTKVVPDLARLQDIRPDEVEAIVDRSLQRLQIEQIPLVQFFWWDMNLGNAVETLGVLDQPQVAGARYARHLPRTLEAFRFALDDADRAAIGAILAQAPGPRGPIFGLEGDRTGRHGRIMKYNLNTNPNDRVLAEGGG